MLIIYQIIGFIIIPLIKLNIQLRIFNKKEDKKRYKERYGLTNKKRPNGKLIWIHAASVGEFKSVSSLINKFYAKYSILVTTTTLTASNYAIKNLRVATCQAKSNSTRNQPRKNQGFGLRSFEE